MSRYFLQLSYNGTSYHGWQRQDNAITVQQVIEEVLQRLFGEFIEITGCGRTDAGVHASKYFAHLELPPSNVLSKEKIIYSLNSVLPQDICIVNLIPVAPEAHARFSAVSRTYEYYISLKKSPFDQQFSWYFHGVNDVEMLNTGTPILMEYKDFSSFSRSHTDVKTNNCDIKYANWFIENDKLIFRITADRFLRNMVRAVVGTLLDFGMGKIDENGLREIITSKNRSKAGKSVPAKGLFLVDVEYPDEIFIK